MQTYARQGTTVGVVLLVSFLSIYCFPDVPCSWLRTGGTSAIFICDDGLQLIPEADRHERIAFYANHNIGWVARPGHSSAPGGFKRAGKFKKASK